MGSRLNGVPAKFLSFNCKSLKRSIECVKSLCKTADIIALQETWLLPHEIPSLGNINQDFGFFGKSAIDTSAGILYGRPYGGVALLWRKSVFRSVSVILCKSERIVAIKVNIGNSSFLIFSVYMPTDCSENLLEFSDCLSEIAAIVENQNVESVFILGDFNAHPGERFGKELISFCVDQNWLCADMSKLGENSDTYTFISEAHGSRRWLDHCVVTNAAWSVVVGVDIHYDIYWSDHFPLEIQCDLSMVRPKFETQNRLSINKVVWGHRDEGQIATYLDLCIKNLRDINTLNDYTLIPCCNRMCYNIDHKKSIDVMYNKIVASLSEAAIFSYNKGKCRKGVRIVGWNKHVKNAHRDARQKFINWVWHGKPISGKLYKEMYESKKLFKQKLKFCQNNEHQIKMDMLVEKHKNKDFKNFWKQTKKVNPKPSIPVSIEGVNEPGKIANLFQKYFKVISPNISSRIVSDVEDGRTDTGEPISFTPNEVFDVIKNMTRGKSPGHDGLSIEHLLHAGPHLSGLLATFYTLCMRHSYLPEQLMRTIVVPIVKKIKPEIYLTKRTIGPSH